MCRNEERAALLASELNTTELIVLWALHAYHYPIERLNIKGLHRDTCCVHGAVSATVLLRLQIETTLRVARINCLG